MLGRGEAKDCAAMGWPIDVVEGGVAPFGMFLEEVVAEAAGAEDTPDSLGKEEVSEMPLCWTVAWMPGRGGVGRSWGEVC